MSATRKKAGKPKKPSVFTVDFGEGRKMAMEARIPYGSFIITAQKAKHYRDLNELIGGEGLTMRAVKRLTEYLDLPNDKLAALIGVSSRTLSRWTDDSPIGVMASKAFLEIDRVLKKGIDIFGSPELFRGWLQQSNVALGNVAPLEMLTEPYGIELVEDALEAMEYGNVM